MTENPTKAETTTVVLCGVGGQGTILAADLLAKTAQASGCDVKLSEVHGMAQRGGAVTTVVRFGREVASMVADPGSADHVVAFETLEALRNLNMLKRGGSLLVNDQSITPLPVATGKARIPQDLDTLLEDAGAYLIAADQLAEEAGNVAAANVVLMGALAAKLEFDLDVWKAQIARRVPEKTVEVNIAAFEAGVSAIEGR